MNYLKIKTAMEGASEAIETQKELDRTLLPLTAASRRRLSLGVT
jgi:hypothetical protein